MRLKRVFGIEIDTCTRCARGTHRRLRNAMAESLFATREKELLMQRRFKSKSEAHTATFEWINGWRNPHRRHSSLGRLSLINFERRLITEQELRT